MSTQIPRIVPRNGNRRWRHGRGSRERGAEEADVQDVPTVSGVFSRLQESVASRQEKAKTASLHSLPQGCLQLQESVGRRA